MSFIIRNTSGGSVTINDLGIVLLAPLDEHDLSQEPPNDVAISSDLPANITAGNIVALDPLDGITVLSVADSLELIAATNDPHYRIRGGRSVDVFYDDSNANLQGGGPVVDDVQLAIEKLDLKRRFKNTTHTGIITGGEITQASPTTISISDGNGAVIDQVATPTNATGTQVVWTGLTGVTLTQEVDGFGSTYIFLTSTGVVAQFLTKPNKQTFINNIFLGVVFYETFVITSIYNEPDVVDSTAVNFNDYVDYLGVGTNLHGVTPIPIGTGDPTSVLEFFITSGTLFALGSNWHADVYNPNIISIPGNGVDDPGPFPAGTGAVWDYILGDGTVFAAGVTQLDETIYDDGTSIPSTSFPGGNNGLIHFIIELPGGKAYVQPHTQTYRDWKAANSSVQAALTSFILADEIKEGIILGAYIGSNDKSDTWERGDRQSIVTFSGGGGGGGSIPDSTEWGTITGTLSNQTDLQAELQLREPTVTGIITGGNVTQVTPTTVDIDAGTGQSVDSWTDPLNPTNINFSWAATLGFVVNMPNNVGVQSIYINSVGTILQKTGFLTSQERRSNAYLAFVYYRSGAIDIVQDTPRISNNTGQTFFDLISFVDIESKINGLEVNAVTAALSVWVSSGEVFVPGVNWNVNNQDPNILSIAQSGNSTTPSAFDIVFADGTIYLTSQTVIPDSYESAPGVVTGLTGNDATTHYFYQTFGGQHILQLGQKLYNNARVARDDLEVDRSIHVGFPGSENLILSAQIYVSNNVPDFSNSQTAGIVNLISGTTNTVGDELVKVSQNDTLTGYLIEKIVAGNNITLATLNPSGDEQLEISTTSPLIVQTVTKNVPTWLVSTTNINIGNTPTSTSGNPFDSSSITMINGTNRVRVQMVIPCDAASTFVIAVAVISRAGTVLAVGSSGGELESTRQIVIDFYDTPGPGTHLYEIRVGRSGTSGRATFNRAEINSTPWGGPLYTNNCNIILTEVLP